MSLKRTQDPATREEEPQFKTVRNADGVISGHDDGVFTILSRSSSYKVQRSVLSKESLYFKQLLEGPTSMSESQTNQIELKTLDDSVLESIIDFMHENTLDITWDTVELLLSSATYFLMDRLTDHCVAFLEENFTFEVMNEVLDMGDKYGLPQIIEFVEEKIAAKFQEFSLSDYYPGLELEMLQNVIKRDDLAIESEKQLFDCLRRRLSDSNCSSDTAEKMYENVRFCLMNSTELNQVCQTIASLPTSIRQLVISAQDYHQGLSTGACLLVRKDIQNRLRHRPPSLILVSEGGWQNNHELVACRESEDSITPIMLYSGTAHHRTCGTVTVDNCLYILSMKFIGGFDHNSAIELTRFDPRTCKEHTMPSPPAQVIISGELSPFDALNWVKTK